MIKKTGNFLQIIDFGVTIYLNICNIVKISFRSTNSCDVATTDGHTYTIMNCSVDELMNKINGESQLNS